MGSPLFWASKRGIVIVPKGFLTNLASIPRILRNIPALDPCGYSRSGAVLHDWLYCSHIYDRKTSDDILREAIIEQGGNAFVARIFWAGVRIGGTRPWDSSQFGPQVSDFETAGAFYQWKRSLLQPVHRTPELQPG